MSKPSSVDEKATAVGEKSKKASEGDFKDREKPAHPNDTSIETEKDGEKPKVTPVPFSQMFRWVTVIVLIWSLALSNNSCRFSTKPEMFIRLVGLVAAAGAGAAQVRTHTPFPGTSSDTCQLPAIAVYTFRELNQRFRSIRNGARTGETRRSRGRCSDSRSR